MFPPRERSPYLLSVSRLSIHPFPAFCRDGDCNCNLRWEGKFRSRTDAQRRLTSVLGEIDKGTYTRPSSLTFEQFSKEWLAGRRQIRGSTESGYDSLIKSQLIPRLGSLTVSHIRFEHIDAAVSGMVEDELAPKTIHNAVMLLRNMLAGQERSECIPSWSCVCRSYAGREVAAS